MPGLVDGTVADGTVAGMAADGAGPAGVGALAGAGAAGDGDPASASPLVHAVAGPTDMVGCPAAGLIAKASCPSQRLQPEPRFVVDTWRAEIQVRSSHAIRKVM